jgi:DNA-binding Lrp family transcriptional regulator
MTQAQVDGLDEIDRAIINAFQGGFPVCEQPFEEAARALSARGVELSGEELLTRVERLDEEGVLTRFGALVNAQAIGGTATLVAMHAPEDRFDEVVEIVNAHREVAHNYEREHPHLNMWFVLSVAEREARRASEQANGETVSSRVEEVLSAIEEETGEKTYNLPKKQEFRVEAKFLLDGPIPDGDVDLSALGPAVEPSGRDSITPNERDLVLAIQGGFPIVADPYKEIARDLDTDAEWIRETIKRFNSEGKIRRVGIIPNHYSLGYTENGMTVWNVPDELVTEVGPAVASLPFVTHCYERPRHEGVWPYNVFAMTHGRSEAESEKRIEQVRERMDEFWDVDDEEWDTLFSTQILKKTGIRLAERADANTTGDSQ